MKITGNRLISKKNYRNIAKNYRMLSARRRQPRALPARRAFSRARMDAGSVPACTCVLLGRAARFPRAAGEFELSSRCSGTRWKLSDPLLGCWRNALEVSAPMSRVRPRGPFLPNTCSWEWQCWQCSLRVWNALDGGGGVAGIRKPQTQVTGQMPTRSAFAFERKV